MSRTSAAPAGPPPVAVPHSLTEDAVAIFTGVLLISVGVAFFTSAGLLTGGTAGLAFLLHYATGIGFGKIFFVLNLPFYWLALRKLGRAFTLKTFIAVLLLSVLLMARLRETSPWRRGKARPPTLGLVEFCQFSTYGSPLCCGAAVASGAVPVLRLLALRSNTWDSPPARMAKESTLASGLTRN